MSLTWADPGTWVQAIKASDQLVSSWPGPRPLTAEDGVDLLVGREKDLTTFVHNITQHRLTHLTGLSGVGKSSLLMAGIIPELIERGYVVGYCRDWSNVAGDDLDVFLARQLYDSIDPETRDHAGLTRTTDLFWELHDLGGRGVIILDQFEEIIRRGRSTQKVVFEFLTGLHLGTQIPIVLSYRSESAPTIQAFDRDMRIDDRHTITQEIQPIGPGAGYELITHPRRPSAAPADWTWEKVVEADTAQAIADDWELARQDEERSDVPVGTLHLQALLYVLSLRARGERITPEDYAALKRQADDPDAPSEIMDFALEECAQLRISLADRAATEIGMDEYLRRGIVSCLTRTVPHLSSGGFKSEQHVHSLAKKVLEDDLEPIEDWLREQFKDEGDEDDVRELVDHVLEQAILTMTSEAMGIEDDEWEESILLAGRTEIARAIDANLNHPLGEERWQGLLAAFDEEGRTSGPLMGMSLLVALLEQLRRFAWAVLWLHELNLARLDSDGAREGTLTLVHDGLGEALEQWAERYRDRDETESLYALIAPEGEVHDWSNEEDQVDLCGHRDAVKVHGNLGLRGCEIRDATLRHAVFVNCDFRGALFVECTFEGVTFLNCRLDGARFSKCRIEGDASPLGGAPVWTDAVSELGSERSYVVDDPFGGLGEALAHYREGGSGSLVLSRSAGVAAVATAGAADGVAFAAPGSGLVIQECWLSGITLRETSFAGGADLRLIRVRGSGLDLSRLTGAGVDTADDLSNPRVSFSECLLRHVAFTAGRSGHVDIAATGSVLTQTWVGKGLTGSFTTTGSAITQLWIEPKTGFSIDIASDCTVTDLVGAQPDPGATAFAVDDRSDNLTKAAPERMHAFRDLMSLTDDGTV